MSEDVRDQLSARLRGNKFALPVDESTDVSKRAQLLTYVCYEWENEIKDDFLFCKELRTTTTIHRQITVHPSKVLEKFDGYFPALTEEQD